MSSISNNTRKKCSKCGKTESDGAVFWRDNSTASDYRSQCRDCCKAYRESRQEQYSQWYEEHKDEKAEYDRKRYQELRSDIRTKQKELYQKNKEDYKKRSRKNYWNNLERERKRGRCRYRKYPEEYKQRARQRKARLKGAEGSFTSTQWEELCSFFDGICPACRKPTDLFTVDHIVPLTWEDTSDWITNIQPLCSLCNARKKNSHDTDYRPEFVKRWALEQVAGD